MSNTLSDNNIKGRTKRQQQKIQIIHKAESIISSQVFDKRSEICEYLKLFGYNSDRTIIQVHITGFFRKRQSSQKERERHIAAVKKYGGLPRLNGKRYAEIKNTDHLFRL